jgi:CheY-like chemotaxis protein/anti-sigma regulatory factor (Ser/Thr protein kinase)
MPTALIVDDSLVDQRLASGLLKNRADLDIVTAEHGAAALQVMDQRLPDVVLTDLQMPEMDGLQLVREVRKRFPAVPVVLMTAMGSEEIAAEALRAGAAGYVPKRYLSRDLAAVVERTLALTGHAREQRHALECLACVESHFVLDNDPSRIQPLLGYVRQDMSRIIRCDETELMRVRVALDEALTNAITHGNLEADSGLRELGGDHYQAVLEERRAAAPYRDRKVYVTCRLTPEQAMFTVRDEGRGFDPGSLPDPTDPSNLDKVAGRGMLLIRTFMDEVRHNDTGNQITMIKRVRP